MLKSNEKKQNCDAKLSEPPNIYFPRQRGWLWMRSVKDTRIYIVERIVTCYRLKVAPVAKGVLLLFCLDYSLIHLLVSSSIIGLTTMMWSRLTSPPYIPRVAKLKRPEDYSERDLARHFEQLEQCKKKQVEAVVYGKRFGYAGYKPKG